MSAMKLFAAQLASFALALAGCGGQPDRLSFVPADQTVRPEQPDIVLIIIDTLRADRLSCYGNERLTSPNIDALAKRGARFENAFAPAPWTLPSTASMLTGRLPQTHGAGLTGPFRDMKTAMPLGPAKAFPTLAQHLEQNGYATHAFVTNPYLTFGLERGFQTFEHQGTEGSDVANFAHDALAEADLERPLFLMLHFMDCHDPLLTPDQDAKTLTTAGALPEIWSRTFETLPMSVEGRDERLLAYDAAIHYVDRQVGRILDSLERSGRANNTIVLVTSDHGEELFEHSAIENEPTFGLPSHRPPGLGHGHSVFDEVLRVPFVIAGPTIPAGQTIAADISLMDVPPTLLQLAGLADKQPAFDGRSLVPALDNNSKGEQALGARITPAERSLWANSLSSGRDQHALITADWKLIENGKGEDAPVYLYDRTKRDGVYETKDVAAEFPEVTAELLEALHKLQAQTEANKGENIDMDEATESRLDALGYTGD